MTVQSDFFSGILESVIWLLNKQLLKQVQMSMVMGRRGRRPVLQLDDVSSSHQPSEFSRPHDQAL